MLGQDGRIKSGWTKHFGEHGKHHVRLDQPAKNGAAFEHLCHKLLDAYPDRRETFEHAASTNLESVEVLMQNVIRRIELPNGHALTERRAEHMQAVLQIGMDRIWKILRER